MSGNDSTNSLPNSARKSVATFKSARFQKQSSGGNSRKAAVDEEINTNIEEDFDLGTFFMFAEKYNDNPYITMAAYLAEKAPKRHRTPFASHDASDVSKISSGEKARS